ncbi:hypothetical protein [Sciscionella marina]|uniref:hypothetical protein n=1 Tax=Sciscionella marina TaxID=508770 RepID=UPI0003825D18|nr:hypothetical protein [Sciscionella marina]
MAYQENGITLDGHQLVLRRYYFPFGAKRIGYDRIRQARVTNPSRLRIWGSGDFVHWYNFDARRPRKTTAIELDLGRRCKPVITPDDPDKVLAELRDAGVSVG